MSRLTASLTGVASPARQAAVARALEMEAEGADVIEIGGEKAGPGEPVEAAEEMRRVLPRDRVNSAGVRRAYLGGHEKAGGGAGRSRRRSRHHQ